MKGSIETLKRISESDPPIKVIFSHRNQLDVILSDVKHRSSKYSLEWKCEPGDDACVQKRKTQRVHLNANSLVGTLRAYQQQQSQLENLLDFYHVPYMKTTYEELLLGEDARPWMDLFCFLGVGPTKGLTKEMVQQACGTAHTSFLNHSDALANFEEVKNVLMNSEFSHLMH